MSVFISYAREDRPYVQRLQRHLEHEGLDVWWDHRLAAGSRYDEDIEARLDASTAVVVILSPHSASSRWVRDEFNYALDEGKAVVPLMIADCRVPLRLRGLHREEVFGAEMPSSGFLASLRGSLMDHSLDVESDVSHEPPDDHRRESASKALRDEIEALRQFEREYRTRLRSYFTERAQALLEHDADADQLTAFYREYLARISSYFEQQVEALNSPRIDALVKPSYSDPADSQLRAFLMEYRARLREYFSTALAQIDDASVALKRGKLALQRDQLVAYFNEQLAALDAPAVGVGSEQNDPDPES